MMVELKKRVHTELMNWVVDREETMVLDLLAAMLHTELVDREETM